MSSMVKEYVLESRAGSGAMGVVYKARHRTLNRAAAVKVLHKQHSSNSELRIRFCNEARAMSGLSHPNIVSLYDFVDEGHTLALVMEYIDGKPLDEIIENETGPIPYERALGLFRQMLEGMSYAHARGMIHRDIKPSNIMVTADDRVKILDLGLALAQDSKRLTQVGAKMGTMFYMALELLTGPNHSVQSDIYALAMTLYEMLSGAMPLDNPESSDFMIMNQIMKEELPDPREYYPHIPTWLVNLLKRSLSKDPAKRYSSCDDMLVELDTNRGNEDFDEPDSMLYLENAEMEISPDPPDYYQSSSGSNVILRSIFSLIGAFFIYLVTMQLVFGVFD